MSYFLHYEGEKTVVDFPAVVVDVVELGIVVVVVSDCEMSEVLGGDEKVEKVVGTVEGEYWILLQKGAAHLDFEGN